MSPAKTSSSRHKRTHVALLRGINVGGKNKLPMKSLVAMFSAAGCEQVGTYIQSGNVLLHASKAVARRLPREIEGAIADQLGLRVPIVMLTAAELSAVARDNPFLEVGTDPKRLHVVFLADQPNEQQLAALDPDRCPPDTFVPRGRTIYLHCPNGVARTKLSNHYFDAALSTISTVRSWRTVLKLVELAER